MAKLNKLGSIRRQSKRIIKARSKSLRVGKYARGCRGHPGIVIERNYDPNYTYTPIDLFGVDVIIKSLVDGIEESCSIKHCNPEPMDENSAKEEAEYIKTHHSYDCAVRQGFPIDEIKSWHEGWMKNGVCYYVLSEQNGYTVRSIPAYTKEEAKTEVMRLSSQWFVDRGISNPHIVDMLTYPAPPTVEYK